MSSFIDQTVIVTGGTRGIGRSISEHFLESGARVIALYSGNTTVAEEFFNHYRSTNRLFIERVDVSCSESCNIFWDNFSNTYGTAQVLVNNAGIRRDSVLAMMSDDDWRGVIDTNLTGTFYMCKHAVKHFMPQKYGRIINITSPSGKFGFFGQSNYAASKAGLVSLTKSLCKEVAKRGITVNCVSPGFISTDFIKDLPDHLLKEYQSSIPLKRFGTPSEVAVAVLFLASTSSSYITGSVLEVTGGL